MIHRFVLNKLNNPWGGGARILLIRKLEKSFIIIQNTKPCLYDICKEFAKR